MYRRGLPHIVYAILHRAKEGSKGSDLDDILDEGWEYTEDVLQLEGVLKVSLPDGRGGEINPLHRNEGLVLINIDYIPPLSSLHIIASSFA